jgi:putative transposase
MSTAGDPYDNAKTESFFKTLKWWEVYLKQYRKFTEAEANIAQFIEEYVQYEALTFQPRLGSSVEFEEVHFQNNEV